MALSGPEHRRRLEGEKVVQQACNGLQAMLKHSHRVKSRADLARRMNLAPSSLHSRFRGSNLLIKTLAEMAWEMGYAVEIHFRPLTRSPITHGDVIETPNKTQIEYVQPG
jgi:hypothetical protein